MKTTPAIGLKEPEATAELVRFLVEENHAQLKEWLSSLSVHIETSWKVDRLSHPEATIISHCFHDLKLLMEQHLSKEEMFVFPVLKKIASGEPGFIADVLLARKPIRELKEEHKNLLSLVLKIKVISDNCNASVDSSPSLKQFCREFRAFERYLHEHIELVENKLFQRIENILKQFSKRKTLKTR